MLQIQTTTNWLDWAKNKMQGEDQFRYIKFLAWLRGLGE